MKAFGNKKFLILLVALILGAGFFFKRTYKIRQCQIKARDLIEDHKKLFDIGAVLVDTAKSARLSEKQMVLLRRLVLARHTIKSFDEAQIRSVSQMGAFNDLSAAIVDLKESSGEMLKDAAFFPTKTRKHTVPHKALQALWGVEIGALHPEKQKAFESCLISK